MTARQWWSVAVSAAVFAGGIAGVAIAASSPTGQLVDLASTPVSSRPRPAVPGGDRPDGAPSVDTSTTTAATTTTMPPRAQPVRLAPTKAGPLLATVIVVDPGHNGQNFKYADVHRAGSLDGDGPICNTAGSSTNAGLDEMVINWEIGTRLATLLRGLGAEVVMTHGDLDGFGPCADERGAIARDANATAFVSIHADGSGAGSSGFHIIHPAPKPNLDPAGVAESKRLAGLVRDDLVFVGGRPANYVGTNGVQERGDLANLNTANRPSILAELGNLKNATDATMLSDRVAYDQIARSLARAIVRFVGKAADAPQLSADLNSDFFPDFLPGAPQLTTTTTTSTLPETTTSTVPETTTSAPVDTTVPVETTAVPG